PFNHLLAPGMVRSPSPDRRWRAAYSPPAAPTAIGIRRAPSRLLRERGVDGAAAREWTLVVGGAIGGRGITAGVALVAGDQPVNHGIPRRGHTPVEVRAVN